MSITIPSTPLPTGTWSVDPAHSRIGFQVRQFGISTVRGVFNEFEGTLELRDDLAGCRVYGSVSVASLDTRHERRDAHLRSPDFLDAEAHPKLAFESSEIRALGAQTLEIDGALTVHGVTRPITLTAELRGTEDPGGDARVTLAVRGRLDRGEYGVAPDSVLDKLVSDQVKLELDISAVRR